MKYCSQFRMQLKLTSCPPQAKGGAACCCYPALPAWRQLTNRQLMLIMSLHAINFPLELLNFTQPLGLLARCPISSALHKSYSIVAGSLEWMDGRKGRGTGWVLSGRRIRRWQSPPSPRAALNAASLLAPALHIRDSRQMSLI